jgi:hypothetical protein
VADQRDAAFGRAELVNLDVPKEAPPEISWRDRLEHWKRERIQKIELMVIFLICLIIILAVIGFIIYQTADPSALPNL